MCTFCVFVIRTNPCEAIESHLYIRTLCALGTHFECLVEYIDLQTHREHDLYKDSARLVLAGEVFRDYATRFPALCITIA